MAYAYAGEGSLDYFPCHYGGSRLLFRGPHRDLAMPYVVSLGGAETYGRFIPRPWPDLVEAATGWRMVNLGCVNAGPDAWLADAGALRVAQGARAAVLQVTGAANLSNRHYAVHPRRNDRFVRANGPLRSLFPEVDFTNFHFTRHLLGTLAEVSPARFATLADDLRAAWVGRMRALIAGLGVPVVLLWIGRAPPPPRGTPAGGDPYLIDAAMIAALRRGVSDYVEVVLSPDTLAQGVQGMAFAPMERPAAEGLPGPAAHEEIAALLSPVLDRLT
ncbi:MAG: hypothetical protein KF887_19560 [Paracoccaceae bacterium]|nr:MAG: hypothetical protein KF887_19560 [Paracoccaceae bacterium]